ncbi:GGDEF domain-containing protein [Undibacterium arcticum]
MDHFKQINDMHGHGVGDQVLVELSRLIHQRIRDSDLAVRYGGEEICLVFPSTTAEHAYAKTQLLLDLFRQTGVQVGDKSISNLTFSAGIAQFPRDGTYSEALLQMADKALYRAKAAGRNRIILAS